MTAPATQLNAAQQDYSRRLAWTAMTTFIREQTIIKPELVNGQLEGPLLNELGCFVTFKKHGQLRGCIGSITASQPLWKDLVERAIHASTRDPRFPAVSPAEIDDLEMEISVLTPLVEIPRWQDIQIGRDGILLQKENHQAVFLPQVAPEQKWNLSTTLDHLARKAGMLPGDWREGCQFFTFQAQVF